MTTQEGQRWLVDTIGSRLEDLKTSLLRVDDWVEWFKGALVTLHCATERLQGERDEARAVARELADLLERLPENYSSRLAALRKEHEWLKRDEG